MAAPEPLTPRELRARSIGIGCLTFFIGFMSMAMVGVLVSAAVASLTKAQTCPEIPACNWYIYALIGGVLGAVTLPVLVLRRLRSPAPGTADSNTRR